MGMKEFQEASDIVGKQIADYIKKIGASKMQTEPHKSVMQFAQNCIMKFRLEMMPAQKEETKKFLAEERAKNLKATGKTLAQMEKPAPKKSSIVTDKVVNADIELKRGKKTKRLTKADLALEANGITPSASQQEKFNFE